MTETLQQAVLRERRSDVTVIGAGLAGLAAAIFLARSGLQVVCLERNPRHDPMVGESLDWSAPDLLKSLELPMEELIEDEISTYKRHVVFKMRDGSTAEYIPSAWLGRPPFNIELRTLHIDRERLHQNLLKLAIHYGVALVYDRVLEIEKRGKMIMAVRTALGQRVFSSWVLDASGSASSFLAREFKLASISYGPKKVAMWSYFPTPQWQEGTTIYTGCPAREYMDWIWEIPIRPGKASVGYVAPGSLVKELRAQGFSVEEILARQLAQFPRFAPLLRETNFPQTSATSFLCRVFKGVCGPNWIILGEAASQSDPITGNGVTAALRHASEASHLILKFQRRTRLSRWARMSYDLRVRAMGRFFNSLIEKIAYDWPIRDRLGFLKAGDAYTIPAWSVNQIYSRLSPNGMASTMLLVVFLASLRGIAWICYRVCKCLPITPQAQADVAF